MVARLVCHVDTENVIAHEGKHIHVARVLGMCGIVAGPAEAAGGDLILQVFFRVLPSRTEQPVTAGGRRGSMHSIRADAQNRGKEGLEGWLGIT